MGSLMELRYRMMMATVSDDIPDYLILPSDYEQIPYVTANGAQAIRTITYVPVQYDEIHARYSGHNGTLLSAGNGTYQLVLIGGFSNSGWYYRYFSSATGAAQFALSPSAWYDLDITDGTLSIDGKTLTIPYEAPLDGTATSLYLFERRNWTTQYTGSVAEFWIKNNGQYKLYLIPCVRKSDQKVGMYDTIGKTFHVSARNDFIAGT